MAQNWSIGPLRWRHASLSEFMFLIVVVFECMAAYNEVNFEIPIKNNSILELLKLHTKFQFSLLRFVPCVYEEVLSVKDPAMHCSLLKI